MFYYSSLLLYEYIKCEQGSCESVEQYFVKSTKNDFVFKNIYWKWCAYILFRIIDAEKDSEIQNKLFVSILKKNKKNGI